MEKLPHKTESNRVIRSLITFCFICLLAISNVMGQNLELTFPFDKNPGGWPETNSKTLTNYTYTLDGKNYTFALGNVKCNSGYLMLYQVAQLGLPAIEGYKLSTITIKNSGGCSTSVKVGVSSSAKSEMYVDGGDPQTWSKTSSIYTYKLPSAEENTVYYLYVTNKNAQIVTLTLTYEPASTTNVTPAPKFSPEPGAYREAQKITISCSKEDASIYYTLDGTTPTKESQLYKEPILIDKTTTIKAIAIADGLEKSSTITGNYIIPALYQTISEFKKAYTETSTEPAIITNDVTVVFHKDGNTYVKDNTASLLVFDYNLFNSFKEGDVISGGIYGTCDIYKGQTELKPLAAPAPSTKNVGAIAPVEATIADILANYEAYDAQLVHLSHVTFNSDTAVKYTAKTKGNGILIAQDGKEMFLFNQFATLDTNLEAKVTFDVTGFIGIYDKTIQIYPRSNADLSTNDVLITVPAPVITFDGEKAEGADSFYSSAKVTMTCDAKDAKILYTTNGSEPILGSKSTYEYYEPFTMTKSCTFKAMTYIDEETHSNIVSKDLTIVLPTVETPVIAVDGEEAPGTDTYFIKAKVSMKCPTEGATIYYTLDGNEPTVDSKIYNEPFEVNTTCMINAVAVKDDYNNSAVVSKMIAIVIPMVSMPTFEPAGGVYTDKVAVTIACKDAGAEIHYTLDKSEPTAKSPIYKDPIEISENTTIKAIATIADWQNSAVATADYTIVKEPTLTVTPSELTFDSKNKTQNIRLSFAFLTDPIKISSSEINQFFVDNQYQVIEQETGNIDIPVHYLGTKTETGTLTITSGKLSATVKLSGKAQLPTPIIDTKLTEDKRLATITMSCPNIDAAIYYNINQKADPTEKSNLYKEAFTIAEESGTYTIKAIAILDGWDNSEVAETTFTIENPQVKPKLVQTVGFEASENFTPNNVYNNTSEVYNGNEFRQWATYYGTVSTTNPIIGKQSMQMRWYTSAPANLGYTRMDYDIKHATHIEFTACNTNNLKLAVSHSIDGGNTYCEPTIYDLKSSKQEFKYVANEKGTDNFVRYKFQIVLPDNAPTSTSRVVLDSVRFYAATSLVNDVTDMPYIRPTSGNYNDTIRVNMVCENKDAKIYYTTDGTTPDEHSTLYTEEFPIFKTTTVKAIAIAPDMKPSLIATNNYVFPVMVKNIQEFKDANTETNAVNYKITGDVTFVYRNGDNIYIADETGGLLIFDQGSKTITTSFNEGDVISGGVYGSYTLYHGLIEMVPSANLAKSEKNNGAVTPAVATFSDIAANYDKYESILVKLENVTFPEGGKFEQDASCNANISQGEETMVCRSVFKNIELEIEEGATADVYGFVLRHDSTLQITPRDVNDIVLKSAEQDTVVTPVITYNEGFITITCATEGASIYYTTDGTNPDTTANLYSEPFAINATSFTVKAIAAKEGMANSNIATLEVNGINDYAQSVSTYPNPTTGNVTISYNDLQVTNILVYSANGQLIQSINATPSQTVINLSNQANGLYFIRLVGDNINLVQKIHKN